jgi:hypothetical protein
MALGVDINETLYKHLSPVLEQKIHAVLWIWIRWILN